MTNHNAAPAPPSFAQLLNVEDGNFIVRRSKKDASGDVIDGEYVYEKGGWNVTDIRTDADGAELVEIQNEESAKLPSREKFEEWQTHEAEVTSSEGQETPSLTENLSSTIESLDEVPEVVSEVGEIALETTVESPDETEKSHREEEAEDEEKTVDTRAERRAKEIKEAEGLKQEVAALEQRTDELVKQLNSSLDDLKSTAIRGESAIKDAVETFRKEIGYQSEKFTSSLEPMIRMWTNVANELQYNSSRNDPEVERVITNIRDHINNAMRELSFLGNAYTQKKEELRTTATQISRGVNYKTKQVATEVEPADGAAFREKQHQVNILQLDDDTTEDFRLRVNREQSLGRTRQRIHDGAEVAQHVSKVFRHIEGEINGRALEASVRLSDHDLQELKVTLRRLGDSLDEAIRMGRNGSNNGRIWANAGMEINQMIGALQNARNKGIGRGNAIELSGFNSMHHALNALKKTE